MRDADTRKDFLERDSMRKNDQATYKAREKALRYLHTYCTYPYLLYRRTEGEKERERGRVRELQFNMGSAWVNYIISKFALLITQ